MEINCEGCAVKEECGYTEFSNDCPCTICLVKVVCADELCNEYGEFQDRCRDAYNH